MNLFGYYPSISARLPQRLERPLWIVAIVCASVGVFWLPWQFPSTKPVNGESYALGFNNRIAIYCLALSIASATAARLVAPRTQTALGWLSRRRQILPPWRIAKLEYVILGVCAFLWGNVLWSWGNYLVDPGWGDARVNIYNIDLLALGRVPYRDFMVIYGFSMIYLPYWMSCLTQGDISFEQAYHAVLVLFATSGFLAIFIFLRALRLPAHSRPLILLLVLLSWAIFVTALAHVPLRYLCVPTGLIVMHKAIQASQAGEYRPAFVAFFAAFLATFLAMAISPDMGLALSFGCCAYAFGLGLQKHFRAAICCISGMALAIAGIVFVFPTYFLTVMAFSGGVFNLPVYPNAHNVLLVTAAVVVLPALIASALKNRSDSRCPLALGLATGGGIMLVGAFGRAAPFHVSCNGVVSLMMLFAATASRGRLYRGSYTALYAVVQIVLLQVSWWAGSYGTLSTALQMRKIYDENPQLVSAWKDKWAALLARHPSGRNFHWSSVLPYPEELDLIARRGSIIQTNGGEWNLWLGRYLLLQPDAPKEFFHCWTQGADTPSQIESRIQECKAATFLLVPEYDLASVMQPVDQEACGRHMARSLSPIMVFPVSSKVRFAPFSPTAVITEQLLTTHKPVGRFQFFIYGSFILMERKND